MSESIQKIAPIVIVVAMAKKNRAIGMKNGLLWHVPADMKRFKTLTLGHPIIMGRKTFESIIEILGQPLPNRTNIVITRDELCSYNGAMITHSLEEALKIARSENPTEVHIGGGAEIYRQALPLVEKLYVTWFDDEQEADTFFPDFESEFEITTMHEPCDHNGLRFQWIDYSRKRS